MNPSKELFCHVQYFFHDYLRRDRGVSPNTILAYRDALKLFLLSAAAFRHKSVSRLVLEDLDADTVLAFLKEIERARKNSAVTRNLRLAALKTFFSYLIPQDTLRAGQYQKIISIPLKRTSPPLMGYLEVKEMREILNSIDRKTSSGQRDYVLLKFLYNTGARVQEACDISVSAFQLQEPAWVTITGKGRKIRQVPLWPETASVLKTYFTNRAILDKPDAKVFVNSAGETLTRFGIRYIIQTRVEQAIPQCPSLASKKISPHTLRHTTAMHLLQAGVDFTVIKSWLGHVNLSTTHLYVEIDLEMKRKALSLCHPLEKSVELQRIIKQNHDVISWLQSV
ncbi:MAG: hypothetical protein A3G33_02430 [Omnitrophica bacterium RIFCSPLOWO2_12_FULL_44_17]|uniref:Integrase n=1 Tax=Candidatus Danuiimicrobium aquiferis TaxID=1801832 RepID=A0A1G1KW58_9BACT|nr:MAG: hypothetical protein A3B72_00320 [Omnitrophica bacterium RIFCSPHIGHO2_02_FULL_45_28]OGW97121.1 MAG: hypothetical protein A3G33_02430 [Omnitrophica bacterium RIFCSPLOWO2_12_FULL_44_17]OGX03887.1 MAG: hypothetical protein A3J12_02385 [Omnitrophica bacterium RIFCSPLOWO2_02_FULL_44_11]